MDLARAFSQSARRNPAKIALFWGDAEFSYGDLWSRSRAVAERLTHDFGVRPGDRVGIWLKNCPEFVPALFGILQSGAVVTPINSFLKPNEVRHILADAGIGVVFIDGTMLEDFKKLRAEWSQLKMFRAEEIAAAPRDPQFGIDDSPWPSSELAVIIYTSGTTGRPKAPC